MKYLVRVYRVEYGDVVVEATSKIGAIQLVQADASKAVWSGERTAAQIDSAQEYHE